MSSGFSIFRFEQAMDNRVIRNNRARFNQLIKEGFTRDEALDNIKSKLAGMERTIRRRQSRARHNRRSVSRRSRRSPSDRRSKTV
jgi:hypothetical protein